MCPSQLLFNVSGSYLSVPLLTQPVEGAHAEHASFKRDARDFVLRTWLPRWQSLPRLSVVLTTVFVIDAGDGMKQGGGDQARGGEHEVGWGGVSRGREVVVVGGGGGGGVMKARTAAQMVTHREAVC